MSDPTQHQADAYDAAQEPRREDYDGREVYLHDGLYARYDGWQFSLRAPREDGDHVVYLDPETLDAFVRFVKSVGGDL